MTAIPEWAKRVLQMMDEMVVHDAMTADWADGEWVLVVKRTSVDNLDFQASGVRRPWYLFGYVAERFRLVWVGGGLQSFETPKERWLTGQPIENAPAMLPTRLWKYSAP